MIVLKVEPGIAPERIEITGDLKSMQEVVGGSIQAIYLYEAPIALVCHEEQSSLVSPSIVLCGVRTGKSMTS